MAISTEYMSRWESPSAVMVTSPYEWKILEWDVKPRTNIQWWGVETLKLPVRLPAIYSTFMAIDLWRFFSEAVTFIPSRTGLGSISPACETEMSRIAVCYRLVFKSVWLAGIASQTPHYLYRVVSVFHILKGFFFTYIKSFLQRFEPIVDCLLNTWPFAKYKIS